MRHRHRARTDLRQAVATLLLLPFLLAALLPQGYMPAVSEDGTFTVTLCTTDGLRTVTLDANGNEVPDAPADEDDSRSGHCIFAGSSVLALLQSGPDLPDVATAATRLSNIHAPGLRLQPFSSRLGARAPPLPI